MTHLSRRDDVRAAVADLVIKGALHVCPREAYYETFSLVIEESLALRSKGTSLGGPPTSSCRDRLAVLWAVAFLPPALSLLPCTESMDCPVAVDRGTPPLLPS